MGSATITDISKLAGVSKATVSRVLNNPSIVDPATRSKVERIIDELHYVPSAAARNLSRSSSTTIGAVVADIANPFFSELLKGVLNVCNGCGYTLICADNGDCIENDFRALDSMREQRVAGLIYAPAVDYVYYTKSDELKRRVDDLHSPVVLVDRKICWDELKPDGVFFNDREAIKKAVVTLAENGHRDIAIINSNEKNFLADNKMAGYEDGIREAGLTFDSRLVFADDMYTVSSGYQQTQKMLELPKLPTAVITCNNLLTQGFIKAVRESERGEAQRIAYISLDGLPMMGILGISYNYIKRDAYLMGQEAANLLFRRMSYPEGARQELLLDAPLVLQTI